MSMPPDDIDAWLDRREPLFRRSSAAAPLEPPAEIDNLVLARARAALRDARGDEASRPAFFTLGQWVMPLGLAATLVVALAIALRLGPVAPAPDVDAAAATEADKAYTVPTATSPAAAASSAADAPAASAMARAPVARTQARRDRDIGAKSQVEARERESLTASTAAGYSAPGAAVTGAVAESAAQAAPPPGAAAAPLAAAALADASSERLAKSELTDDQADPERWYRKILDLRTQGKRNEAEREWRALKARYPHFEAPKLEASPTPTR